jgi:hypothetical protein
LQTVIRAFEREAKLPDDLSELQNLYRDKLNGKQVLILADDAKDVAQVRPLMPPPGCALLVTSRHRFSLPGMTALDLGTLPPEQAEKLLQEICPRIDSYASELAKLCGYLPLALRVSASLLKDNDSRDVARYLEQLRSERLKHLSDPDNLNDPQASVEASLRLSYGALETKAQLVFSQLSVFPASFDIAAAKAIVIVHDDIAAMLELLRRRSLLEWDATAGRYDLHDLVREFGAAQLKDAKTIWLRYARYYAQVAMRAKKLFQQSGDLFGDAMALMDHERALINVGFAWAVNQTRAGDSDAEVVLIKYVAASMWELADDEIPFTSDANVDVEG